MRYLVLFFFGIVSAMGASAFPLFVRHVIDYQFERGYQVSVVDIDRDGLLDIVALATVPSRLTWYKNPDWTAYTVSSKGDRNIDLAPMDVDGDGDQDLALASEFDLGNSSAGGSIYWLECPADPCVEQEWSMHRIDAIPTSHRVRWADLDGDGKRELLNLPIIGVDSHAPEYSVGVQFKAYTIPANPATDAWPQHVIDSSLCMAHGICVVPDVGKDVVLTASFDGVYRHASAPGLNDFTKTQMGVGNRGARPQQGSSEVGFGHRADGAAFIATLEPWHGNEVVVDEAEAGTTSPPWTRTVIDSTFKDGHALLCVDLDQDGADEIVAGHRGEPYNLFAYRRDASGTWQRIGLDLGGMSAAGLFAADINRDGRVDLVATGSATSNVVWYENRG